MPKKARGRPFPRGNPGRPPGSRNKTTRLLEQLAEGHAEQLMQKAVDMALNGDVACLRMMLDRVSPPRKDRPVDIDTPPIKTSEDLLMAINSIWQRNMPYYKSFLREWTKIVRSGALDGAHSDIR